MLKHIIIIIITFSIFSKSSLSCSWSCFNLLKGKVSNSDILVNVWRKGPPVKASNSFCKLLAFARAWKIKKSAQVN